MTPESVTRHLIAILGVGNRDRPLYSLNYSAVTRVCERFARKLNNPELRKRASMVIRELSNVQG